MIANNIEKNDDGTYKYHRIVSLNRGITLINSINKTIISVWYLILLLYKNINPLMQIGTNKTIKYNL